MDSVVLLWNFSLVNTADKMSKSLTRFTSTVSHFV